ncbi:MAG: hypothetical protein ABW007_12130 [Chitinophagaceae bacterium]
MNTKSQTVDRFERAKLLHDYFKHLTTISTGSIAFLVTFIKEFTEPKVGLGWFAGALVAFLICVASSVAAQTAYIWYASNPEKTLPTKSIYQTGLVGSWLGLVAGVFCLVIFAFYRLF